MLPHSNLCIGTPSEGDPRTLPHPPEVSLFFGDTRTLTQDFMLARHVPLQLKPLCQP